MGLRNSGAGSGLRPGITCVDVHRTDAKRVATGGMDAQATDPGLRAKGKSLLLFGLQVRWR